MLLGSTFPNTRYLFVGPGIDGEESRYDVSIFTQPNSGMMEGVVRRGCVIVERSLVGAWGRHLEGGVWNVSRVRGKPHVMADGDEGVNKPTKLELPQQAGPTLHTYLIFAKLSEGTELWLVWEFPSATSCCPVPPFLNSCRAFRLASRSAP